MRKKLLIICMFLLIFTVIVVSYNIINGIINENREKEIARINRINEIRGKEIIIPISEDIEKEKIAWTNTSSAFTRGDMSNKYTIAENAEYIIIGTVNSIEGMSNYNPTTGTYVMARTVGTIKVDKILKGDLKEDVIPFVRLGGTLPIIEYEKSLPAAHREKVGLNKLTKEEKENKYVKETMEGDISIENGKTYLMYISYSTYYERYSIEFVQYGLREVESTALTSESKILNASTKSLNSNDCKTIKVKNNTTGKYETLKEVLPNEYTR